MNNFYKNISKYTNNRYTFIENTFFKNHLICYLTLAGSYAYGLNAENSDIDIRGFYLENKNEFFTLIDIQDSYVDQETDTTLYSFKKFIKLLINCNPNIIELLGTNNEHILFINNIGELVRNNYLLFLSKKIYNTFIGYANSQLKRLEKINEKEILLQVLQSNLPEQIKINNEFNCNINYNNISLKELISIVKNIDNIINQFHKINHRNKKKDDIHLYKHASHLIRLYLTGIDILKEQKINTYRKEHKLLMNIKQGKMTMEEIFELTDNLQKEIDLAYKYTILPNKPNYDKINQLMLQVYNL